MLDLSGDMFNNNQLGIPISPQLRRDSISSKDSGAADLEDNFVELKVNKKSILLNNLNASQSLINKLNAEKNGGEIKLMKMLRHYEQYHPTKVYREEHNSGIKEIPFGICDDLGDLVPFKRCLKKTTPMSRQIGIGPTLFLMSSKSFAILFILLTIMCIPIFMFLGS